MKGKLDRIKNVILDIGGVVLKWDNESLVELLHKTDNEINKIDKLIYGDKRFKECILGNLSQYEYRKQLIKENPEYADDIEKVLSEDYQEKSLPVIKETLEEIYKLKNKGYKIYFLSNITDISYNYLKNKLNLLDKVDGGVYSCKEHIKKPSKEIFDRIIKRYNLKKEETIFFDDSEKNVKVGNEYGIKSYKFKNVDDIKILNL